MSKRHTKTENMYSSAVVQALEQQYCSSCSAAVVSPCLVSSMGFGERVVSRIYNGGRKVVYTAAVGAMLANNMAIPAKAMTISPGVVSTNLVISSGTVVDVYGTTSKATIKSFGTENIYEGGAAISTLVTSEGTMQVFSGGNATSTTILSGGVQNVFSGGDASRTLISGGQQEVFAGGNTDGGGIDSQGRQIVHGTAYNAVLNTLGSQVVSASGLAISTRINGGWQEISSGGIASGTINSKGGQYVFFGGSALETNIQGTGSQMIKGEARDTLMYGGRQEILSGGFAYNTLLSGGSQLVSSAGSAISTQIGGISQSVGTGSQIIVAGGEAVSTIINVGSQVLSSGGSASDTTINSKGTQIISSGALAVNTTLNRGSQIISSGGVGNSTTVNSLGNQHVFSGGVATNTSINANGGQYISGGTANSTIVNSLGSQYIYSGGIANDTTINISGRQYISGGIAIGTIINGGAQAISSGGVASNTNINTGGQNISEGGIANDTIVNSGGRQTITFNGTANNTIVHSGGYQVISSHGAVANNTTVHSGGSQYLHSGAVANNTILNGGSQGVNFGAVARNTTINAGGIQALYAGTAEGTTLNDNGIMNVYQGTVSDLTTNGGTINAFGNNVLQGNISLTNANVNIQHSSGMNTLGIENLSANNATFNMNVDLVEQTGDKLSITEGYTGNVNLKLTNVATSANETIGNGIKLVEFGSNANVDGIFDLVGGQWDEGGYVYKLEQGTQQGLGKDYYLRNTHELTDTFKTMLNIPVMNAMMAQAGMNSLQRRLGDLRAMDNTQAHQGVWVRSYYKDMTVKDLAKTDMSLFGAEAGYDWLFRADEPTKLYAGVLVGFVAANSIKTENNRGMYDKGDGEAPGVGVYATLINENGWFVDIAARNFWSKLDMKNHASDGTELAYKPNRNVFAASVELGKSFNSELSRNRFIRIEPKVEVGYMNAAASTTDVGNTSNQIKYDAANYINAKAGVLLSYNAIRSNGLLIEPLLELAYRYEFDGKGNVSYAGAKSESDLGGGTAEINAGLNMQLTDNLYWYGLGSYEASDKVKGWGVHAGIRYTFGESKYKYRAKKKK